MKTKLSDMTEHLFEMAERLLDSDDVCVNEEATKEEISKAKAMTDIANAVVSIQQMELSKTELELKSAKLAKDMGLKYIPKSFEGCAKLEAPLDPDVHRADRVKGLKDSMDSILSDNC